MFVYSLSLQQELNKQKDDLLISVFFHHHIWYIPSQNLLLNMFWNYFYLLYHSQLANKTTDSFGVLCLLGAKKTNLNDSFSFTKFNHKQNTDNQQGWIIIIG